MDKKGIFMTSPRKIISWVLGLILLALGIIPVLAQFNIIDFTIPTLPAFILWSVGMVGGVVLIVDGFKEMMEFGFAKFVMAASFLVAIVIFVYGLNEFGILPWVLPTLAQTIINIILVLAGILLIVGGFMGF